MRTRAAGIVIKDGQILLMKRFKNGETYYVVPGGGVEEGETPEDAVVREVMEETMVEVRVQEKLASFPGFYIDKEELHELFLCEYVSGTPALSEGSVEELRTTETNTYEPMWVDLSILNSVKLNPKSTQDFVLSFCNKFN